MNEYHHGCFKRYFSFHLLFSSLLFSSLLFSSHFLSCQLSLSPAEQVAIVLRKSGSNVRLVVARPIGEFNPLVDYVPGEPPVVPTIELSDGQIDMVALGYAHLHPRRVVDVGTDVSQNCKFITIQKPIVDQDVDLSLSPLSFLLFSLPFLPLIPMKKVWQ